MNENGSTLVLVLLIFSLLLGLGLALVTTSETDFQIAGNYSDMTEALYVAEAGIKHAAGQQNDTSQSPRYLKNSSTYKTSPDDVDGDGNKVLKDHTITDPSGNTLGVVSRLVMGQNPITSDPPYTIRSTGKVGYGSHVMTRTVEADIQPTSLLEYAVWSESSMTFNAGFVGEGLVYVDGNMTVSSGSPVAVFNGKVEYTGTLSDGSGANATYNAGVEQVTALPTLTTLVTLSDFENYTKDNSTGAVCGTGRGIYIGATSGSENLFLSDQVAFPGAYQIDLTLFDFSGPSQVAPYATYPIQYNGVNVAAETSGGPVLDATGSAGYTCTGCVLKQVPVEADITSGTTTINVTAGQGDRFVVGQTVFFDGANEGQRRKVTAVTANSVTVDAVLPSTPGAGDKISRVGLAYDAANCQAGCVLTYINDFNGIIYANGPLHIWGINGGRSVEDIAYADNATPAGARYWGPNAGNPAGPAEQGKNVYSNHNLDTEATSEDDNTILKCPDTFANDDDCPVACNTKCPASCTTIACTPNVFDAARKGRSLTIVTAAGNDIIIDHNIFMGQDSSGVPVRTALISGEAFETLETAPRTTFVHAALLATSTGVCSSSSRSFRPCTGATNQPVGVGYGQYNDWAQRPDGSFKYDLDFDGTLETNNGAGQAEDQNEESMHQGWSLRVLGNMIMLGGFVSGKYSVTPQRFRTYDYDATLQTYEPPCYPILPYFDVVAGTFREIRD